MSIEMFNLINDNYLELFRHYCKYQNKYKISNSNSCEDYFNNKILLFIELDIPNPTLPLLQQFLKTKRKDINKLYFIEYKENVVFSDEPSEIHKNKLLLQSIDYPQQPDPEDAIIQEKLKLLFIDYRKPKKKIV